MAAASVSGVIQGQLGSWQAWCVEGLRAALRRTERFSVAPCRQGCRVRLNAGGELLRNSADSQAADAFSQMG